MVPVASAPSIRTRPVVGSSNPAMMLKIVLLPQPDGPIRLTKQPCGIASVTGASAWNTPAGFLDVMSVLNDMPTLSTQSLGSTQSFGAGYGIAHSRHPWRRTEIPPDPGLARKSRAKEHGCFMGG